MRKEEIAGRGSAAAPRNGLLIAALVLGIASIPFGLLTVFLGVACAVIAIVLGVLGLRQVRRGVATRTGFAIAGLVAAGIGLVVSIVVLVISLRGIDRCKHHIGHTPNQKELRQCARDHV